MPATTHWSAQALAGIPGQPGAALPVFTAADAAAAAAPGLDLWDMWQIADRDARTVIVDGRQFWFFLATARLPDPEARHDQARIRLLSHGADGWRDHGWTFAPGFTPGSREWSGSAVLEGEALTMYFTAAGRAGAPRTFEQRLFETHGRFRVEAGEPVTDGWSVPVESVAADGHWYARADQAEPGAHGILGFRDPGYFRDPATGREHLLFVGSAGWDERPSNGVIGLASRGGGERAWRIAPPPVEALGVNSELERPHVHRFDGLYYLFWTTQGRRFAPGIVAPTGLYAMVAERFEGPWRPVNGTGLVAANPPAEPRQGYCWWVTGERTVLSFVDYWGLGGRDADADVALRRERFGGTAAPFVTLAIDGDRVEWRG